jgi:uncharacterized protein (DUF1499 family)
LGTRRAVVAASLRGETWATVAPRPGRQYLQPMKLLLIAAIITGVLALILAGGLIALNRSQGGRSVGSPNLAEGVLAPCPESPNCVSTRAPAEDTQHAIEAIPVSGTPADIVAAIAAVVEAQPRMAVVERGDRYLRATATSALFHFVDDVDFIVDPDAAVVHMRSASRVGEGDMGVNRRRYELFRDAIPKELSR